MRSRSDKPCGLGAGTRAYARLKPRRRWILSLPKTLGSPRPGLVPHADLLMADIIGLVYTRDYPHHSPGGRSFSSKRTFLLKSDGAM